MEKLVADFKRALYGAKSEKSGPDQYQLAREDIETAMAEDEAMDPPKPKTTKRKPGIDLAPDHRVLHRF